MWTKSLSSAIVPLVLMVSSVLAVPVSSWPALSAVTVTVTETSASLEGTKTQKETSNMHTTTSAATFVASMESTAPSATATASGTGAADFGSCSTPEITFSDHLNGGTETAFIPANLSSFNHGSDNNIDVIASFICQQLRNKCTANMAAIDLCSKATAAADTAVKGTGSQADEFNAVFGITTHFANVPVINSNVRTIAEGSLTTAASSTKGDSGKATSTKGSNTKATETTTSFKNAAACPSSNNQDQQSATTLNPKVIATGFAQNGQATQEAGQVPSLTSRNNFINFCLTANLPITNGQQIKTGSCNPAPMGIIASTNNMPSSKFVFPKNGGTAPANKPFTVQMAIRNLEAGHFVNAQSNYYAAPQQVNAQGNIIGHTHFVIEKLDSLDQTKPTNPRNFAFFKGVNTAAVNGVVSATVTSGLPPGAYRLASINAAANHQPVLVAIAQHGSLDDMVYFTIT